MVFASPIRTDPMPLTSERYAALVKQKIETNTQLAKAAGIKVN